MNCRGCSNRHVLNFWMFLATCHHRAVCEYPMSAFARTRPTMSFFGQHSKNTCLSPHTTHTCDAVAFAPTSCVLVRSLPPPVVLWSCSGLLDPNLSGACLNLHVSPNRHVFPDTHCQQSPLLSGGVPTGVGAFCMSCVATLRASR